MSHIVLIQLKLKIDMKRFCVAIAVAMSVFVVSCAETGSRVSIAVEEHQNWDGAKLYGNVAHIASTQYELAGSYGRFVKTELMSQKSVEFNERGDVTLEAEYDIDSMLIERRAYQYDEKGYLVDYVYEDEGSRSENRYLRDVYGYVVERNLLKADGSLDTRYTTKYNANGDVVEEARYSSDNAMERKVVTEYDAKHNPQKVFNYSGDGTMLRREVYAYDESGRLVELSEYDTYDNVESRKVVTYGENGKDEDVVVYDCNGACDSHYANRYDESGRLVEHTTYDAKGAIIERKASVYDANNNVVEQVVTTANDVVLKVVTNKYDDKGLLVQAIEDDRLHGKYDMMLYAYDSQNNLIRETNYYGKRLEPQYVVEYVITYRE